MNSFYHAKISAKRHGGEPSDYQPVHDFIDSSKSCLGDVRHRALLHNTWGVFLCERMFGVTIENGEGKAVPTRLIAEEHIQDDLGFIPTVEHWLGEMPVQVWMGGTGKKDPTALPGGAAASYKRRLRDV